MGRRDKFRRHLVSKLLPQAAAPAAAAAATAAAGATAAPASTTAPSSPSSSAAPASSSPVQPLFPVMRLVENPSSSKPSSPRLVFVSLSSDLRLIDVKPGASAPTSLLDFRRPRLKLVLDRVQGIEAPDPASIRSLDSVTEPRVSTAAHVVGPAVRVSDGSKQAILLIADTFHERDALLQVLRLRIAPWRTLRAHMKDEMAAVRLPEASSSSFVADAAREFLAGAPGESTAEKKARTVGVAKRVWEKATTVAEMMIWTAAFAQGSASIAKTAEEVEKFAKLLGGLTIVGCALSIVALSAKVVNLIALEMKGRGELVKAGGDLREASLLLLRWLFTILSSGFQDEDGLVNNVFDILGECWRCGDELEQYLLQGRVGRVWTAEDVSSIISKADSVSAKLLGAGLLKTVAGLERRIDTIERKSCVVDSFIPRSPDPADLNTGLVANAAVQLARLKEAVCPSSETSSAHESSASTRRVALTSVDGEGGVGKTSTCKLLCSDVAIQKRFAGGAIIWIEVGKDASVEAVNEKITSVVEFCGGKLSAQRIRESKIPGVSAAVAIARTFFSNSRIMLVLDNVWHPRLNIGVKSWAAELTKIASCQGSVVLMTTRFENLAESPGFERVRVGPYDLTSDDSSDWRRAENLYDVLLGDSAEKRATSVYMNIRRKSLLLSCGIPLGIATFVGLVRDRRKAGYDANEVLLRIKARSLGLADKFVGEDQEIKVGHRGLFAAMEECLMFLDEHKGRRIKKKPLSLPRDKEERNRRCLLWNAAYDEYPGKELSSRYAALHMLLESSPTASFSVLSELWHVQEIEEVERIAFDFVDIGLARWHGAGEKALVLHDLQYEFCGLFSGMTSAGVLTKGFEVPVNGHALFLSSCESLLAFDKAGDKNSMWARFCFNQSIPSNATHVGLRDYLVKHLLRHFCSAAPDHGIDFAKSHPEICAASKREIVLVLSDFFWLRGRFYSPGGRNSLLRDFASALESGLLCQSDTFSLRRILQSVMLVGDDDSCHSGGTLASSLVQMAKSVEADNSVSDTVLLKKLAKDATEEALGAWLKPISGCRLTSERGVLRKAAISSAAVDFVSCTGDGMHFVSLSRDGMVRVYDFFYFGAELILEDIPGIFSIAVVQQNYANISPIIFSVDNDGAVRWLRMSFDETGRVLVSSRGFVGYSKSQPSLLFASKEGNFVVAGYRDGIVCVWEPVKGNSSSYVLKVRLFCSEDEADEDCVKSVVVSESGLFVAAYTSSGGLYFWKEENRNTEPVKRQTPLTSESRPAGTGFMFLSSDETNLIILFDCPPAYEIWNVKTCERRSLYVELPGITLISCANLADGMVDKDFGFSLLVGGCDCGDGSVLVEYSIGHKLEIVRMCRLLVEPFVLCSADSSDETGVSRVIVGGVDGSVRLLGADAFDASRTMGQRESAMLSEEAFGQYPFLDSDNKITSVAVMPDASSIVAGHESGRLSFWSVEDGSFDRAIDSERKVEYINCIDIGADMSVAVTGHAFGTLLVWEVSVWTWTVRCTLEGLCHTVICAASLANTKRVAAVDSAGEWRVWDAKRGGAALCAIKMGAYESENYKTRGLISPDGGQFIWATRVLFHFESSERWQAKVIDVRGQRVVFESDKHRDWDELCAELDSRVSQTEAIASWKEAANFGNEICNLHDWGEESCKCWKISLDFTGRRVLCASISGEGEVSDKASISLDSIRSIAAQWLPDLGEDGRRRAVVASADGEKVFPVIMHFITSKA